MLLDLALNNNPIDNVGFSVLATEANFTITLYCSRISQDTSKNK